MAALFRLLLVVGLGYLVFQFLRSRLEQARAQDPAPPRPAPGPKVIAFERTPWQVLDLEEGANRRAIDAAYARLREANSPEKLAGMSDELRALAERRTRELDDAYQLLVAEEGQDRPH